MIQGIDIGNATTKVNGKVLFDSKVTMIEPMNCNNILTIDNKTYYLGEGEYDTTYRKVDKDNYIVFLYAALSQTSKSVHNKIVLGLPLSQYKEDKEVLINRVLENKDKTVVFNDIKKHIVIDDVEVFPEALVTLQDDYNGIIIDIGGRTTDIALIEYCRGKRRILNPISLPDGTINLYSNFINSINRKFSLDLELKDAERILENGLMLDGKMIDISFALDNFKYFTEKVIGNIQLEYSLRTNKVSLTGGGAYIFENAFRKRLGNCVEVQRDSIGANSRNFYELGCEIWQ